MTERVVIRCPGCQRKLRVGRPALLNGLRCPECGTSFRSNANTTAPSPTPKAAPAPSRKKSARADDPASHLDATRSTPADKTAARNRRSGKSTAPPKRTSGKNRPQHQAQFLDDDWDSADSEPDENVGAPAANDAYALDDAYDDGYDEDYGDNWLDDDFGDGSREDAGQYDDWSKPPKSSAKKQPARGGKPKSDKKQTSKQKRTSGKSVAAAVGHPVAWIGAGVVAGILSFGLTVALGFTGISLLIILSAFVSAGLIGGSIRAMAGTTDGWGPGLVAVAIAVPAIFLGRIGAYYVDPDIAEITADSNRTSDEIRQDIDSRISPDGMITQIIEDEIAYDDQWQRGNGISEDNFYADLDIDEDEDWEDVPGRDMYSPIVWAEGERRWNSLPPEIQADRTEDRRLQLLLDEGVIDEESLASLIQRRTSDTVMTQTLSHELQQNEAWLTTAGVTYDQINLHYHQTNTAENPLERIHPVVRDEASKRWAEMPDDEKASRRSAVEQEIRDQVVSLDERRDESGKFRLGAAVVWGLLSLLMPFRPILITIGSVVLAFKLGSGLASG
ncbi:MAG: hypothetical protein R3C19_08540 [Planctomycetaceae bacterium]